MRLQEPAPESRRVKGSIAAIHRSLPRDSLALALRLRQHLGGRVLLAHRYHAFFQSYWPGSMPLDLNASRIKLKAAREHIERLKKCTSPLDPKYYDISLIETPGPVIMLNPPKSYRLVYTPKEPIPETLANIIGDALGNLKSALDYAAVRIDAPGTYFPTAPRSDLPNQRTLTKLEAALPGFRDLLLNTLRPENGPDEPLWGLIGKANNENKHEDFIPTLTMVEVQGINARIGTSSLNNCAGGDDAARPINLIRSAAPIQFSSDCKTLVAMTFGASTSVPNEAVIPTLNRAADAVERTLNEIDKSANPYPWASGSGAIANNP